MLLVILTVLTAHTPVLLEGRRALDGRLLGASRLEDVVGAAVGLDRTDDAGG